MPIIAIDPGNVQSGYCVIDQKTLRPLEFGKIDNEELLEKLEADHSVVITLEDGILNGGFGEKIARFYGNSDMKVLCYGLRKEFLDRYDAGEVMKANRLTPDQIAEDVINTL